MSTVYFQQRTVARAVHCSGVGLHSGRNVNLIIHPAPVNHGIKFRRTDLLDCPSISAQFNMVVDTSLATVIGFDGFIVSTIEHLMASFAGLHIDNALVEVDAYELPILDGSAARFVSLIREAGIREQEAPRYCFVLKDTIELREGDKFVIARPDTSFRISYTVEFDHPVIRRQSLSIELTDEVFEHEISRARTFGFLHEIEYLKRYGLARGGSLDNAVVIDKDSILNPEGTRFSDEFVRHKILDCIGDLSLLGLPIMGHLELNKSGHAFNHAFLENFFTRRKLWETKPLREAVHQPHREPKPLAI